MKNKKTGEVRCIYEQSVFMACGACNRKIEDARKVFRAARNVARAARDREIDKAKAIYEKEMK